MVWNAAGPAEVSRDIGLVNRGERRQEAEVQPRMSTATEAGAVAHGLAGKALTDAREGESPRHGPTIVKRKRGAISRPRAPSSMEEHPIQTDASMASQDLVSVLYQPLQILQIWEFFVNEYEYMIWSGSIRITCFG